ncbi:DUF4312 family protein [Companilactobacillus musae]|uniref:DUF4312 family protein n=1 Tax=Companilactobacillus musae TaxID=1903258 RepID=UPI000E646667|nr:DUF4312 family protein [Companilactobacillus musae]
MSSELNKKFVKTVRVSGDGETRQRAFASALNNIRNEVIKDESQVTLQIIPKEVRVLYAERVSYQEKFLFFFFKRTRVNYKLTLDVDVELNAVKLSDINFIDNEIPSPDHINIPDFTKLLRGDK